VKLRRDEMVGDEYLKHLTVAVVAVGATIVAYTSPNHTTETYMIFAMILGYVFKNGYGAVKKQ